jgi:hypothetical protein
MPFEFTDQHIQDYHQLGFTIFRELIPVSLLGDLRREAEKGRGIARQRSGEQAQRLQPIKSFAEQMSLKPFEDFVRLPQLRDAIAKLLGPNFWYGLLRDEPMHATGILYEPAAQPWCTRWHRDWRDNVPGLEIKVWEAKQNDLRYFNQVNCALYDDTSTWVVPGSHLRRDTLGEARRFPTRPIPQPDVTGKTPEEAEYECRRYCESMPGAFEARLHAGDFMLYRNSLWHLGNYVPYRKRATIHDAIGTAEFADWFTNWPRRSKESTEREAFENPNQELLGALSS